MKKLSILITALILIFSVNSFCATLEDWLGPGLQIAVEKNTGRGNDYETGFSGYIGSLSINISEGVISISEFTMIEDKLSVVNGIYRITKLEKYDKNINFECIDLSPLTHGLLWTGKVWLTDNKELKIEMIQRQSPRRWVNLGENGNKFLKANKLNLHLGL